MCIFVRFSVSLGFSLYASSFVSRCTCSFSKAHISVSLSSPAVSVSLCVIFLVLSTCLRCSLKIHCLSLRIVSVSPLLMLSLARALRETISLFLTLSLGLSLNTFYVSLCVHLRLSPSFTDNPSPRSHLGFSLAGSLSRISCSLSTLFCHGNQLPPWPPRALADKSPSFSAAQWWLDAGRMSIATSHPHLQFGILPAFSSPPSIQGGGCRND